MRDVNSCTFIGRLGRDPEARSTPNGDSIANFSIACSDDYKDKSGNKIERTNWIYIVAFRQLADVVSMYTKKGSRIYVRGKQVTRKWTDKEGNDKYTTEIVADEIQLLDKASDASTGDKGRGSAGKPKQSVGFDDLEECPF